MKNMNQTRLVILVVIALVALVSKTNCLNKTCEIGCPMDCPYGVKYENNTELGCVDCICAEKESLCETVKCRAGYACKVVPTIEGCELPEMCAYKATCVQTTKKGHCPEVLSTNLTLNEDNTDCIYDSDCKDDMKCCITSDVKVLCLKPCLKMMCKCASKYQVVYEKNLQGCFVCKCVKKANNTPTDQDMVVLDICKLNSDTGTCKGSHEKYFYNKDTRKCEKFIYGGCEGNENRFDTLEECQNRCICNLDKESGMCMAYFEKYYFNRNTSQCEKFVYGGCGGNGNRFDSFEQCHDVCDPLIPVPATPTIPEESASYNCSLPQERGMCMAWIPRIFFNTTSEKCELFHYGGCGGNGNNFETMESCMGKCSPSSKDKYKVKDECLKEADTGNCKASIQRYYFNKNTFKCEKFIYGGCQGNENNFESQFECEMKCFNLED